MSWQPSKQMMVTSISEMNGGITWVHSPLFFKKDLFEFSFWYGSVDIVLMVICYYVQ